MIHILYHINDTNLRGFMIKAVSKALEGISCFTWAPQS